MTNRLICRDFKRVWPDDHVEPDMVDEPAVEAAIMLCISGG